MTTVLSKTLVVILIGFLIGSGPACAQTDRAIALNEDNPWFSFYVIDKISKSQGALTKGFALKEEAAVKKIDASLAFAYPKTVGLRPAGIIAGERDKRFAMIYRKMAYFAANDQVVSAQILFYSAVRLKEIENKKGLLLDLPFLTLNHFIYNALCVDDENETPTDQSVCMMVHAAALRGQKELTNEKLKQYVNWAALGLGFDDKIAFEAGVSLMETEKPSRKEKDIIKSILKPFLAKNAG